MPGLKKKLAAASKTAGCSTLELWVQPISNHLYWCAALGAGDPELVVDMWKSMANHICNVHVGHEGLYTECAHDDLDDRQWLKPG